MTTEGIRSIAAYSLDSIQTILVKYVPGPKSRKLLLGLLLGTSLAVLTRIMRKLRNTTTSKNWNYPYDFIVGELMEGW